MYTGNVSFFNNSTHKGDTTRRVNLTVNSSSPTPATVQLFAVQVDHNTGEGATIVIWAFDTVIESMDAWQNPLEELPLLVQAEDMDGLLLWWAPINAVIDADPHKLIVTYDIPMASPLPWKVEANPTALHFAGGGTLQIPASGTA